MKTQSLKKALVLLMAVAMLAGCAQEKMAGSNDDGNNPQATPTPGPGATPTPLPDNHPLNNEAGSTVTFQYSDLATLNEYVQSRPLNNPQNMKINVKVTDVGSGRYDGHVKLGYYDTGTYYIGIFNTTFSGSQYQPYPTSPVQGGNQTYKNAYQGYLNSEFNNWFMRGGKRVFHGFFQDRIGAVVLVITGGVDQGDGGGYAEVNGEIWFKNFEVAPAQQSPTQCWFHFSPSPYRCGTFYTCGSDSGSCVIPKTGRPLRPGNGYKLLGTFQSLNKAKAFGN
ncbi:MAG: hypothetical protein KF767_13205 [Bdellovibrionaceae bacterium]|nr:hypothetical protein [Pseudobdellovibrionaceae bacterium]